MPRSGCPAAKRHGLNAVSFYARFVCKSLRQLKFSLVGYAIAAGESRVARAAGLSRSAAQREVPKPMSQRTTRAPRTAEAAVDRLEKLYADATAGLERGARSLPEHGPAAVRSRARHVSLSAAARRAPRPRPPRAHAPARVRPPAAHRRVRDHHHASARLPPLPARAAQPAADGIRRQVRGGGQRPGNPLSVCARARRRADRRQRHRRRAGAAVPDAAPVDGRRRDRRRPDGTARG